MTAEGGTGITITSQSGHGMPQLLPEEDEQLAITPTEELPGLELLQIENIMDTLHAYKLTKCCKKNVSWEKQ